VTVEKNRKYWSMFQRKYYKSSKRAVLQRQKEINIHKKGGKKDYCEKQLTWLNECDARDVSISRITVIWRQQ
jgi:hypothetical protein